MSVVFFMLLDSMNQTHTIFLFLHMRIANPSHVVYFNYRTWPLHARLGSASLIALRHSSDSKQSAPAQKIKGGSCVTWQEERRKPCCQLWLDRKINWRFLFWKGEPSLSHFMQTVHHLRGPALPKLDLPHSDFPSFQPLRTWVRMIALRMENRSLVQMDKWLDIKAQEVAW